MTSCLCGWQQTSNSLEAENYVPDRLLSCTPSAAKPVIESKYKLRPGLADLHLLVGSWSLWSTAYIYVWLESSYDPPEGHPGQLATFSWFVSYRCLSSQFQFSLSAVTLEYLSQCFWPSCERTLEQGDVKKTMFLLLPLEFAATTTTLSSANTAVIAASLLSI